MKTREQRIYGVTIAGSVVNCLLLAFKFVAGIIGHSSAMIADAVHSLSDFITDIIVIIFVKVSSLPEDEDHDYGHGKYETLATMFIGLILVGVGVMIGWNGIRDIIAAIHGEILPQPGIVALIAALVSITLKEVIFRITKKVSKEVDSSALEANAWHHRSDALSSVGTAAGIGGAILFGAKWTVLDPIAASIVSVFIIASAVKILLDASGELLDRSLPADVEKKIEETVYQDLEVCDIHHLRTRKIGNRVAIDMHLRLPGEMSLSEAHDHATEIESLLRKEFGEATHIMLHLEPKK